jgi:hypothetical protein
MAAEARHEPIGRLLRDWLIFVRTQKLIVLRARAVLRLIRLRAVVSNSASTAIS